MTTEAQSIADYLEALAQKQVESAARLALMIAADNVRAGFHEDEKSA